MFRQKSPAPPARYGLSRHRWRRSRTATATATSEAEAEPVAPPRTRRGGRRSKALDCDDATAASSLQRRRCKSYDNLNLSATSMQENHPSSAKTAVVTPTKGSAVAWSAAAAERSIDSAEGFGRRFRRSIRRMSKAKVMMHAQWHIWISRKWQDSLCIEQLGWTNYL